MTVSFEIPNSLERLLRRDFGNLDDAAKEAALVELYRQGKLTQHELAEALGLTRIETDAILKKHNVTEDLPTDAELAVGLSNLRRLLGT